MAPLFRQPADAPTLCPRAAERWFWQLVTQPAILDFAERRLSCPDIVLWHADLLAKEPGGAAEDTEVMWHQDQMYWEGQGIGVEGPVAGLWIPFDDVVEDTGTMAVRTLPRLRTCRIVFFGRGD